VEADPRRAERKRSSPMIPAAFAYRRASSVDEATRMLAEGGDVKILAGGHSLIPLMRLRLAEPSTLVDINGLDRELGYIRRDNGTLHIGALAHADPAGDFGTLALMFDATITTNKRSIAARDFFKGLFTTPLQADEI